VISLLRLKVSQKTFKDYKDYNITMGNAFSQFLLVLQVAFLFAYCKPDSFHAFCSNEHGDVRRSKLRGKSGEHNLSNRSDASATASCK